jgi:hypothetical protein
VDTVIFEGEFSDISEKDFMPHELPKVFELSSNDDLKSYKVTILAITDKFIYAEVDEVTISEDVVITKTSSIVKCRRS